MKKLICIVLIFIMMLTACSKWEVEIVDPTKPFESEAEIPEIKEPEETNPGESCATPEDSYEPYEVKNVEKDEAESFFYSEEGYENMAFLAGWLGAKTFENTENYINAANLIYFMPEFYGILGEESMTDDGVFLQVPEKMANKYLLKYFGVDYKPQETDSLYNSKTNCYEIATAGGGMPNEVISYSHPFNISKNRFSVNMLLLVWEDELGKQFVNSEMVFDVMEDADGKFLRLVSNKASEPFRKVSFEMQAQSLARQLLQVMNKKNIEEEKLNITDDIAANFVMHAAVFAGSAENFDICTPYIGSFGMIEGYCYYLPVSEIKRVAFEVFGTEDFDYDFGSNFEHNSENGWLITGFEWGMGNGNRAKDMVTTVSENIYSVEFTLNYVGTNSEGDPELMEGDRYVMSFELIDDEFLRYAGFKKA